MTAGNVDALDSAPAADVAAEFLMARRPYRTPRIPPVVGIKGACRILGIQKMTLTRWMKPGSGTPETSHGPDDTYMLPPRRVDDGTGEENGWPIWAKEDVERFAQEIGRQRALSDRFKQQA